MSYHIHKVMSENKHKGWHSRGYLPHCDEPFRIQAITFHLADSLPGEVLRKLKQDFPKGHELDKRKRIEEYLNNGYGDCHFSDVRIAEVVEETLLKFDSDRYRLIAWVIMPNHVHVIIEIIEGSTLGKILHSWKSYTASEANKILRRKGIFWHPDYFDRFIRDEKHLETAVHYIHWNPVKAGLAEAP